MSDETLSARSRTIFGLVGAGVLAASAALIAVGATQSHEGSTYYTARFGTAGQGLDPEKSEVKIRGIEVGTVASLELRDDGKVSVRLRLDEGVRIPDTTVAAIEPVSVFGPKDLTLNLGEHELSGPYLDDGGHIEKTRDPQELADTAWPTYELTQAINPDDVVTLLHTFGTGLSGQGPALRRTIDNGTKVIDATHRNREVIRSLLNDLTGVSQTLGTRGDTVTGIAGDFNELSAVINAKPDKVTRLLDEASELGDRVGGTLQRQGGNLGDVVDGAADVADVANGQLRNVPVMIDSLNGFFRLLAQIIRIPGPDGTMIAQASNRLPLDICGIIRDLCPTTSFETSFGNGAANNTAKTNGTNGTNGRRP
ncbi:MlaD family protein [Actinomadura algeriensis]|uniref:Phospholipid/cholesterol/gamma-HCH transport system substrate-binding protein n=1 Tax=Actinomadura algeriensis TaxID=1679523 RepID=A0ABR9JKS4_9ACTN|nr:MlaD family protein [Actinomadura algeriensis]MBE1530986.1 phospholipid/cholesterol/gamma-HCH transport system substrate-binding protein [Actinomadura algeriensis]